jgi:hypothetical protein
VRWCGVAVIATDNDRADWFPRFGGFHSMNISVAGGLHGAGGMGWHRHEDIGAWQRADELCTQVRTLCSRATFERDPRLRGQLLDAGRSGPRNIAEGKR